MNSVQLSIYLLYGLLLYYYMEGWLGLFFLFKQHGCWDGNVCLSVPWSVGQSTTLIQTETS